MFLEGNVVIGDWLSHVQEWWKQRHRKNILFLHYEDMVRDTKHAIQQIAQHLKQHLNDELVAKILDYTSFKNMKNNPMTNYENVKNGKYIRSDISPFMRKGIVGDWKNHFTVEQSLQFDKIYDQALHSSNIHVKYQI